MAWLDRRPGFSATTYGGHAIAGMPETRGQAARRCCAGLRFSFLAGCVVLLLCQVAYVAQAMDLGDLLRKVEKNTPALKAAHARASMQRFMLRQAKSNYFGEIDAVARNSSYDADRLINPISYPAHLEPDLFAENQIGYGFSGRLPLDINGRIRARVQAADRKLEEALAREQEVRLKVLHTAADLYHDLEGVKAVEEAREKQLQALAAHVRVAGVAVEAGRIAPVEKLRLVADLESVRGKLAVLKGQEAGIRARLAALMGSESFRDQVQPVTGPCSMGGEINHSLDDRPDVHALEADRKAADAEVREVFASRLPDLHLSGNWMRNQGYDGAGDETWAVFVQLQVPLWDGGSRRAAVAKAEAGRDAAVYELADLKNRARADIASARADIVAAETGYRAAVASVAAAKETARIQSDRFGEGRLSAADLVDAEAALAAARSEKALALARWLQADDHLRLAVGLEPLAYVKPVGPSGQARHARQTR